MFVYKDNEQINTEIKVLYVRENTSGTKVAEKLGMSQQNFAKIIKKKNLAFSDIQKILDVLGYDLEINFKKRNQ